MNTAGILQPNRDSLAWAECKAHGDDRYSDGNFLKPADLIFRQASHVITSLIALIPFDSPLQRHLQP
jgi:hypothetical protein